MLGNLADLPNPASVAQGYLFYAIDTGQTFILHIFASTGVRQWVLLTASVPVISIVGGSGVDVTYLGGTLVAPATKGVNFSATSTEATAYELTAAGLTVTLRSTDAVGQRYEFYDNSGNANPNETFTPDGGKLITGPGVVAGASITLTVQGFWRAVTKMSNGNWLMSGL